MPRSYSFDHYQVPKKDVHVVPEDEKKTYAEAQTTGGDTKIHYGKAHAQTEEILAAKRMNAQLEELAGIEAEKPVAPKAKHAKKAKQAQAPVALDEPDLPRGTPIGALPVTEEPPLHQQGPLWREVVDLATGQVRMVRLAARDFGVASFRLARLPLELVQLAARRLRPTHA